MDEVRLHPQALMAALQANHDHKADPGRKGCGIEKAIRAYLAASLSPSEMEVVSFDGVAKRKLDGLLERGWKVSGYALHQDGDHGLITTGGFVGWFSVAERNDADARAKLEAAEAQVLRLTEENEGLRDLLEEKRGCINMQRERHSSAEARIKALEEALAHLAECNLSNPHDFRQFARTALKENAL